MNQTPICDFCSCPEPAVASEADDFELIRGVAGSKGKWCACAECAKLVEDYRWEELADRCIGSPYAGGDFADLREQVGDDELHAFLVSLYQEMALNMNGHTEEVRL